MCPFAQPATRSPSTHKQQIETFIGQADFPCVGARSALNRKRIRYGHYPILGSQQAARELCAALADFSANFPDPGNEPVSFVATFDGRITGGEEQFERLLWQQLRLMHEYDRESAVWNKDVSSDPANSEFSMSIAGRAFFVVGMFPQASRLARRSPLPCLVFNFHDQFVAFKSTGKYAGMQKVTRARDIALQGSINPVLARFGEASEARQYSGRAVSADWVCPFDQPSANDE